MNNLLDMRDQTAMSDQTYTFIVQPDDLRSAPSAASGTKPGKARLDLFLMAQNGVSLSRSQVRKRILEGDVTVNGASVKAGYWLKEADMVQVTLPAPRPSTLTAEAIPLDIVYEDEHVLVINKAVGMVVHPAPGHQEGTLVHGLLHHCSTLSGIGGVQRPGIVHRLDRDTSGLMLVAKTDAAHASLTDQLQTRTLTRIYQAVVHGAMKSETGRIEAPIGRHRKDRKKMAVVPDAGRYALTLYQVLRQYAGYALLQLELKTGRTHQIRVHLKHIQHPVVGDPVYGNSSKNNLDMPRQALHAHSVRFRHPVSGKPLRFEAALPEDVQRLVDRLELRIKN
jgi:23S rRNA pseudouridine1911/1915/1917 synthase